MSLHSLAIHVIALTEVKSLSMSLHSLAIHVMVLTEVQSLSLSLHSLGTGTSFGGDLITGTDVGTSVGSTTGNGRSGNSQWLHCSHLLVVLAKSHSQLAERGGP